MKLFIDDTRQPSDCGFNNSEWNLVTNYDSAMEFIEKHKPQRIAFDHDLSVEHYSGDFSKEKTGMDIAKKIIEMDMDGHETITKDFTFSVHSMNPDGKRNIRNILRRYFYNKHGIENLKDLSK